MPLQNTSEAQRARKRLARIKIRTR
jgi:hypothetical protein